MPEGLRAMLTEAMRAYGLAHSAQLQRERQAKAEQQEHLQLLRAQQQAQIQQIQTSYQRDQSIAGAKLERIGHLISAIEEVKNASTELLKKTGLTYVASAPLRLDEVAVPAHDTDDAVASLFMAAQLAYVDLKTALLRLAADYINQACWDEARRVLGSLLEDAKDPLYQDAHDLLCETYYLSSEYALQSGDAYGAIRELQRLALIDIGYKKAFQTLEGLFTQQAAKNEWDLAAQIFVTLEKVRVVNPSILQMFETSQLFQTAIGAITDVEQVWSINVYCSIYHIQVSQVLRLVFSHNNSLIGLYGYGEDPSDGKWYPCLCVVDALTGAILSQYVQNTGYLEAEALYFDDSSQYLCLYYLYASRRFISKSNMITGRIDHKEVNTTIFKSPQFNQAINGVLLAKIKREAKEALTASAASSNGLYVVAAYQGGKLVLYRKAPSL